MHDARVEVDIGVELALHEIVVLQGDFLECFSEFEQGVVLKPKFMQNFIAGFLHEFGAWVVVFVNTVTKAHEFDARVFIFDFLHELAHFGNATHFLDVLKHVQTRFVGTTVGRAPQASHTRSNRCKGVGARRAAQTHGRGRRVLFMVCMQDKDAIQGALKYWVDHIVFARRAEHHP